jgi:hypothetical protein
MAKNPNGYGDLPGAHAAAYVTPGGALPWDRAPRTPRFVDMLTGTPAPMATSAAVLWDEVNLYIRFWAEEPNLSATMTERDALLFFENDLEIFIDGGDSYYQLEFNALGTVYEVFYIWRDAYQWGGTWDQPRFDVHHPRIHSFGGDYERTRDTFWTGAHPRGRRWAFLDYDLPGLQVTISVVGTVNDPSDVDRGWQADLVIPWAGLADLAGGRSLPPKDGDVWGIFMGRFQQIATRSDVVTAGWAAHPFGVADTHVPECFTKVRFDPRNRI